LPDDITDGQSVWCTGHFEDGSACRAEDCDTDISKVKAVIAILVVVKFDGYLGWKSLRVES
jgi:hypothetical protein